MSLSLCVYPCHSFDMPLVFRLMNRRSQSSCILNSNKDIANFGSTESIIYRLGKVVAKTFSLVILVQLHCKPHFSVQILFLAIRGKKLSRNICSERIFAEGGYKYCLRLRIWKILIKLISVNFFFY